MKQWRNWILALAVVALSACGGSSSDDDSTSSSYIRLVNLTSASSLSLTTDGTVTNSGVVANGASAYATVDSDTYSIVVNAADGSLTSSAAQSVGLGGSVYYTVFAYPRNGAINISAVVDDNEEPSTNYTLLTVVDAAGDAGTLDVYLVPHGADVSNYSAQYANITTASSSLDQSIASGTYDIVVTGAGKPEDIRLTLPSVTLNSKEITTLLLTGTSGGNLVNGALIDQGGTVRVNQKADKARVRIVGGFGNDGSLVNVTLSAGTVSSLTSPSIGVYTRVPAGASIASMSFTTAGGVAAIGSVPTTAFASGGDYTILVSGTTSLPQVSVLTDNNQASTSSTLTKIRLVNAAVATTAGGLSLTHNNVQIISNQAYGTASSYTGVTSGSAQLYLTSPLATFSAYTVPGLTSGTLPFLSAGGVYTLFALQASNPQVIVLSKDR